MSSILKPLVSICILCSAFAIAYVANAQSGSSTESVTVSTSSTTTAAVPPIQTRHERLLEAAAATGGTSLSPNRQSRIINLAANLSNRMDAAHWRFNNITNRLESRLVKLELSGFSTTEAKNALNDSRTSLTIAGDLLQTIDDLVVRAVTAHEPVNALAELRATYETIATALRQSHASLRIAIALTKAAQQSSTSNATSTAPAV